MTLGTKTLLFGVHQIFIHPLLVTYAWVKLYKCFPNWRELLCIFVHDWGYWGRPSLKCADGDKHPELGAKIAEKLLGPPWGDFVLGHSSFYMARNNIPRSKLFGADKYWHCLIPLWLYKALAVPTGEFRHYREMKHARQVADEWVSDEEWWANLQKVCQKKIDNDYEVDLKNLAN